MKFLPCLLFGLSLPLYAPCYGAPPTADAQAAAADLKSPKAIEEWKTATLKTVEEVFTKMINEAEEELKQDVRNEQQRLTERLSLVADAAKELYQARLAYLSACLDLAKDKPAAEAKCAEILNTLWAEDVAAYKNLNTWMPKAEDDSLWGPSEEQTPPLVNAMNGVFINMPEEIEAVAQTQSDMWAAMLRVAEERITNCYTDEGPAIGIGQAPVSRHVWNAEQDAGVKKTIEIGALFKATLKAWEKYAAAMQPAISGAPADSDSGNAYNEDYLHQRLLENKRTYYTLIIKRAVDA